MVQEIITYLILAATAFWLFIKLYQMFQVKPGVPKTIHGTGHKCTSCSTGCELKGNSLNQGGFL